MNIEIKIDENCEKDKIIIITKEINKEIDSIIKNIKKDSFDFIPAYKNDKVEILEKNNIFRFYANQGKVMAQTQNDEYTIKMRLYEIEEKLINDNFIRISNSDIVNLKKVKNFDLSYAGSIKVTLKNDQYTYVSRRYLSKIKEKIGL